MAAILVDELSASNLYLGVCGENNIEVITIDCSAWLTTYPNATFTVFAQLPRRSDVYPVSGVQVEDGVITWNVSSYDTSAAGNGMVEVRMYDDEKLKKSFMARTRIMPSLSGEETVPNEEAATWLGAIVANEKDRQSNEEVRQQQEQAREENSSAIFAKIAGMEVSVETLEPGSDATVTKTETGTEYSLSFAIPRGDKGDKGDKGDPGEVTQAELDAVTSQLADNATAINEKTGYGVLSGLVVSAQTTPDMTVKVSTGVAYMSNGTRYAPAAVASLAVTAADATNPRVDIVYLSSAGVVTYLAGTAAATPSAPATPAGGLLLAEISVAANATTIVAANIAARKKNLWSEDWITPTLLNGWTSVFGETVQYRKHANGLVELRGSLRKSELSGIAFYLPPGYRPQQTLYAGATSQDTHARLLIMLSDGAVTPDKGTPAGRITLTGVFFSTN